MVHIKGLEKNEIQEMFQVGKRKYVKVTKILKVATFWIALDLLLTC